MAENRESRKAKVIDVLLSLIHIDAADEEDSVYRGGARQSSYNCYCLIASKRWSCFSVNSENVLC